MSTVERIRVLRVPSPLVRPFVTAVRRTHHLDVTLVEITDSEGRHGWGEAATSWRVTGESPEGVAAAVAGPLGDAVLGRDLADPAGAAEIARAVWGNAAARSAVECAAVDLDAQDRALPVVRVLGGAADVSGIRTDMTLSAGAPAQTAALAGEHAEAGFRCLKIKASAEHDTVAVLAAVRSVIGRDVALRIDANQAWDAATAIRIIRACEDAGLALEFVEQPVAAHDLDALARVTAAVDTPIMADESVRTALDVRRIAERGAAHLVNLKLAKTGGLVEAASAARTAVEAGLGVVFGCMMESHVGVTAAAHLAAAFAPEIVHDLDAALWLRRSPVAGGIHSTGDTLDLGTASGFGIHGLASDAAADVLADVHTRSAVRA